MIKLHVCYVGARTFSQMLLGKRQKAKTLDRMTVSLVTPDRKTLDRVMIVRMTVANVTIRRKTVSTINLLGQFTVSQITLFW